MRCESGISFGLLHSLAWHQRFSEHIYRLIMASPRGRQVKMVSPGQLNERSRNFTLMLLVEKEPEKRSYKNKGGIEKMYCAFHGVGSDGHRQDCVFFGEAYDNMPEIRRGS